MIKSGGYSNSCGLFSSVNKCLALSSLYQFLAILLRLPTEVLVSALKESTFKSAVLKSMDDIGFDETYAKAIAVALDEVSQFLLSDDSVLHTIRHEYTMLFSHPVRPKVDIYESLFLYWERHPNGTYDEAPRLFISDAALDAERCYRKVGLYRSQSVNEPADHMATELEFIGRLIEYKADLEHRPNSNEIVKVDDVIKEFLALHLKKWGAPFFRRVTVSTDNLLYKTIGLLGSAVVDYTINSE
jgi:TorA maturation chaperone TorD